MQQASHTRLVALSKRFLWCLIAAMVVLVIWIAAGGSENKARIVFSSISKAVKVNNLMLKPQYQGVDSRDRPYTVTAESASQNDSNIVQLHKIDADMMLNSDTWFGLVAGEGALNLQTKELTLNKDVNIFYGQGYEFRTAQLHVDIDKGTAYGNSQVEGQGPLGTLKADAFELTDQGRTIRFKGSIKMKIYR